MQTSCFGGCRGAGGLAGQAVFSRHLVALNPHLVALKLSEEPPRIVVPLPRVLPRPLLLATPLGRDSHRLILLRLDRPNNPRWRCPLALPVQNKPSRAPLPPLASLVLSAPLVLCPVPPMLVRAPVPRLVMDVGIWAHDPVSVGRRTLVGSCAAALQHLVYNLASEELVPRKLHPPNCRTLRDRGHSTRSDVDSHTRRCCCCCRPHMWLAEFLMDRGIH
jgi:hypothetical protein